MRRTLFFLALGVFFVARIDLWLWTDDRLVLGLPVGLTFHVLFCLATVVLMSLLVRYAWPTKLAAEASDSDETAR